MEVKVYEQDDCVEKIYTFVDVNRVSTQTIELLVAKDHDSDEIFFGVDDTFGSSVEFALSKDDVKQLILELQELIA